MISLVQRAVATVGLVLLVRRLLLATRRTKLLLTPAQQQHFTVGIIGAGLGGMATAKRLMDLGISFTIYEMDHDFGGTWLKNTYPGCGCDIPSHAYSFSWAPNPEWTRKWAKQPELLEYFQFVARHRLHLAPHTRFGTKVQTAKFKQGKWTLEVKDLHSGEVSQHSHAFLMSAVGQLNIASIPAHLDVSKFQGESIFHSAVWPKDLQLEGKRVAVVGTGASAIQFVPELAKQCAKVHVYQRSKMHMFDKQDYEYPAWARFLFKYIPLSMLVYRYYVFITLEGLFFGIIPNVKGSFGNKLAADMSLEFMNLQTDDANRGKLVPRQGEIAGCKRLLLSTEYCGLFREGAVCELHDDEVVAITSNGVVTAKGGDTVHDVDIVVLGTGFATGKFLNGLDIEAWTGTEFVNLHRDVWHNNTLAEAYHGVTVKHMPNFAMCYAANTNLNHSSICSIIECEVEHFVALITKVISTGKQAFCVKANKHDEYNTREQELLSNTVFSADCNSWYKQGKMGKIFSNFHGGLFEFWLSTQKPKWDDYTLS
ncbi:hypothetical protein BASA81_010554 [Batrachochytrium salamandrivorans]|nr:hypothetical protein BASA81_010554 [Batrachochytrium salamandrivorans]